MSYQPPDQKIIARRNLLWRIEALKEPLTPWQRGMLVKANEALADGRYPEGEGFMMRAERPDLWGWRT